MATLNVSDGPTGSSDLNIPQNAPQVEFSVEFLVLMVLSGLTVLTNALILATFYIEKKLRTYTNCYILNITIADFIVGLLCMPILSMIHLFNGWPFGKVASILFMGFQNSILGVSVCGVVVVCIDRYMATFYPIQHYQRRSIRKASVVNIFTWLSSFGVWMMVTSAWDFIKPTNLVISSGLSRPNYSLTYTASLIVFALRFGLPFLLMTGLYIRIYFRIKNIGGKHLSKYMKKEKKGIEQTIANSAPENKGRGPLGTHAQDISESQTSSTSIQETVSIDSISLHMKNNMINRAEEATMKMGIHETENEQSPNGNDNEPKTKDRSQEDEVISTYKNMGVSKKPKRESRAEGRKAMKTMTLIVLVFILTWLPTAVSVTMYALAPDFYRTLNKTIRLSEITRWIAFSNSLVNPLAYALAQPLFRQTIITILCHTRCRQRGTIC